MTPKNAHQREQGRILPNEKEREAKGPTRSYREGQKRFGDSSSSPSASSKSARLKKSSPPLPPPPPPHSPPHSVVESSGQTSASPLRGAWRRSSGCPREEKRPSGRFLSFLSLFLSFFLVCEKREKRVEGCLSHFAGSLLLRFFFPSSSPLLVFPPPLFAMTRTILIAIDDSVEAEKALVWTLENFYKCGSERGALNRRGRGSGNSNHCRIVSHAPSSRPRPRSLLSPSLPVSVSSLPFPGRETTSTSSTSSLACSSLRSSGRRLWTFCRNR